MLAVPGRARFPHRTRPAPSPSLLRPRPRPRRPPPPRPRLRQPPSRARQLGFLAAATAAGPGPLQRPPRPLHTRSGSPAPAPTTPRPLHTHSGSPRSHPQGELSGLARVHRKQRKRVRNPPVPPAPLLNVDGIKFAATQVKEDGAFLPWLRSKAGSAISSALRIVTSPLGRSVLG